MAAMLALPLTAHAQSDEIQVYTGALAAPGEFSLTLHDNYILDGAKTPAFPGGIVPDHSFNGVAEWAYGVNDWFEAGLYLPLYTRERDGSVLINGAKLRALFAVPHADDRSFFYGVNFELSYNAKHWDTSHMSGEIRPIVGFREGPVDVILNPILDTAFDGLSHLDFAPSLRVAYNLSPQWAVAAEHYADFGPVNGFLPGNAQEHTLFAVADYAAEGLDIEAGIGFGLTDASDKTVLKLILAHSF